MEGQLAVAYAPVDPYIIATVDYRVGSVPLLLRRTFASIVQGVLPGRRPSFMPEVLEALETNQDCMAFFERRVEELKGLACEDLARCAPNAYSESLEFAMAIIESRARHQKEWVGQARPACVTTAFLPASTVDLRVLQAQSVDHLIAMTFNFIDSELCKQFQNRLGQL